MKKLVGALLSLVCFDLFGSRFFHLSLNLPQFDCFSSHFILSYFFMFCLSKGKLFAHLALKKLITLSLHSNPKSLFSPPLPTFLLCVLSCFSLLSHLGLSILILPTPPLSLSSLCLPVSLPLRLCCGCTVEQFHQPKFPEAVQGGSSHQAAEAGRNHPHLAVDLRSVLQGLRLIMQR